MIKAYYESRIVSSASKFNVYQKSPGCHSDKIHMGGSLVECY